MRAFCAAGSQGPSLWRRCLLQFRVHAQVGDLSTPEISKLASFALFQGDGDHSHLHCLWGRSGDVLASLCVGGRGCIFRGLTCVCLSSSICKPGDEGISWMCKNQVRLPPGLEQGFEAKALLSPGRAWCTGGGVWERGGWPLTFPGKEVGDFSRGGRLWYQRAERREVTSFLSVLNVRTAIDWTGFSGTCHHPSYPRFPGGCIPLHMMAEPHGKQLMHFLSLQSRGFG